MSTPSLFWIQSRLTHFGTTVASVQAETLAAAIAQERAKLEAKGWTVESIGESKGARSLSDTELAAQDSEE